MAKRGQGQQTRRERVEQLRREQKAQERRRTIIIIVACAAVAAVIIGVGAFPIVNGWINDPSRKPMTDFGVAASAASCQEAPKDPATGVSDHKPDGEKVKYTTAPPSAGPHWAVPAAFERKFYEKADRPQLETLVHNLEHGYTIVWYDDTIAKDKDQLNALKDIAKRFETSTPSGDKKFIAAAWDDADGKFPEGKHVAFSRWATQAGHREYCASVSGEAIEAFMKKYPWTDSPEPNAL